MKRVLIAGAGSFVGISFENWIKARGSEILIDTVDMEDEAWQRNDFRGYDVVFHVAGIAHVPSENLTEQQERRYTWVNRDLALQCAKKAKAEGVSRFLFMSSMSVYGECAGIGQKKVITKDTVPAPVNAYGRSKLQAEKELVKLQDENFKVVILRCPMIYGRVALSNKKDGPGTDNGMAQAVSAKGNYPILAKLAKNLPVFPREENVRSMLYIGNLCKFVEHMIEKEEQGIFYPQNASYVCTSEMAVLIAANHGKRLYLTGLFHPLLVLLDKSGGRWGKLARKAFGSIVYEPEMSRYSEPYQIYSLEESVRLTEKA